MDNAAKGREIIQAVVTLAHNLGMDVVAEGVETSHQWDQLESLGCEYGQGFYFSRPVDSPVAEALLTRRLQSIEETDRQNDPAENPGPPIETQLPAENAPVDLEKMRMTLSKQLYLG
jgi:predicted signal transduction protein with EAL and GGDEF domain